MHETGNRAGEPATDRCRPLPVNLPDAGAGARAHDAPLALHPTPPQNSSRSIPPRPTFPPLSPLAPTREGEARRQRAREGPLPSTLLFKPSWIGATLDGFCRSVGLGCRARSKTPRTLDLGSMPFALAMAQLAAFRLSPGAQGYPEA